MCANEDIVKINIDNSITICNSLDLSQRKIVVAISGCSGSGKSTCSSVLSNYLKTKGIESLVVSADNFTKRIPICNDIERLMIFRKKAYENMIKEKIYDNSKVLILKDLERKNSDSDRSLLSKYSWYNIYFDGGKKGLRSYLGSSEEIDYEGINNLIADFKKNNKILFSREVGTTSDSIYYKKLDISKTKVFILEGTHVHSSQLDNVDFFVYLHSTPELTLERRKLRSRGTDEIDSHFIKLVLNLEQELITSRVTLETIIINEGKKLEYKDFLMEVKKNVFK